MIFMFNLGKNSTETNQLICQAYDKNTAGKSAIKKWFKKLRKGDFDLNDKTHSGKPQETKEVELQELLDEDATQSTRDLAKRLHHNRKRI